MTDLVEHIVASYLHRYPGAEFAYRDDAENNLGVRLIRRLLSLMDMKMGTRASASTSAAALYGTAPDPEEAQQRLELHGERLFEQRCATASTVLSAEDIDHLVRVVDERHNRAAQTRSES